MTGKCVGIVVCVLMLVAVASPAAARGDLHGSIVFSQEADGSAAWGMAWNYGSGMAATRDAYGECQGAGGNSCREVGEFTNACGALAIGDNNGYGTGWGDSITEAENDALIQCLSVNSNCRLEASQCVQGEATFASSDDDSRMVYEEGAGSEDDSKMAYEEGDESDDASGMTYEAELRALEERVEAARIEEARQARLAEEHRAEEARQARLAEERRMAEERRAEEARQARLAEERRVEESWWVAEELAEDERRIAEYERRPGPYDPGGVMYGLRQDFNNTLQQIQELGEARRQAEARQQAENQRRYEAQARQQEAAAQQYEAQRRQAEARRQQEEAQRQREAARRQQEQAQRQAKLQRLQNAAAAHCVKQRRVANKGSLVVATIEIGNSCPYTIKVGGASSYSNFRRLGKNKDEYGRLLYWATKSIGLTTLSPNEWEPAPSVEMIVDDRGGSVRYIACQAPFSPYFTSPDGSSYGCVD